MIRTVIIEDKLYMQEEIKSMLSTFFLKEVVVVGGATSVSEGVDIIEKFNPDLVLLDVQITGGTGFDVVEQCIYKDFEIIFITGFDSSAIRAIKLGALDYILKPIDEIEFKEAINKVVFNKDSEITNLNTSINVSRNYYNEVENNRIVLRNSEGLYNIKIDDIYYCKSDVNYTTVYLKGDEKIIVSIHLKKIESLLFGNIFIRCHQSYLVNKNYVHKYIKTGYLILEEEIQIPVSQRRKEHTISQIFG